MSGSLLSINAVAIDKNTGEVRGVAHSITKLASEMQRRNIEDRSINPHTMQKLISDAILKKKNSNYKRLNNNYYKVEEIKGMIDEQAKLIIGPVLESKGMVDY